MTVYALMRIMGNRQTDNMAAERNRWSNPWSSGQFARCIQGLGPRRVYIR